MGEEVEAGPSSRPGKLKFQNKIFLCVNASFLLLDIPSYGGDVPAPSDVGKRLRQDPQAEQVN